MRPNLIGIAAIPLARCQNQAAINPVQNAMSASTIWISLTYSARSFPVV
jgi:hypothetical protein